MCIRDRVSTQSTGGSALVLGNLTWHRLLLPTEAMSRRSSISSSISTLSTTSTRGRWVPDHEAAACMRCREKFSLLTRRHHCRKCGVCVCDGCSKGRLALTRGVRRVCDGCLSEANNPEQQSPGLPTSPQMIRATTPAAQVRSTEERLTAKGYGNEWVDDSASKNCMLCDAGFSLLERRHHCRKCGQLVCWSCSENNFKLELLGEAEQRVCDPCFGLLRDNTRDTSTEWAEEIHAQRAAISKWLYFFYPFASEHNTGYGTIAAIVMEAVHLPACDMDLMGKATAGGQSKGSCDPYVMVSLPGSEEVVHKTKTESSDVNPIWDEEFRAEVKRPAPTVCFQVYDKNSLTSDTLMGTVHVPLSTLQDGEVHEHWYEISLEEAIAQKQRKSAVKPKMRLRLRFTYSQLGEFFAYFLTPIPAAPDLGAPFDQGVLIGNIQRLVGLLMPIVSVLMYMIYIVKWENPVLSAGVLVGWILLCQCVGYLPALCCMGWLLYAMWGFVRARSRKASLDALHAVSTALQKGLEVGPDSVVWKQQAYHTQQGCEEDSLQDADAGLLSTLLDSVLPKSLNSTLRWAQNLLGSICVGIEALIDLFQWKSTTASLGLSATLLVCAVVCVLLPLRWLVLVVGSLVFFGNTGPFAGLMWVMAGANRYLGRRRNAGGVGACLLYTSDAADEEDSVDLGGRRIIKKKKKEKKVRSTKEIIQVMTSVYGQYK
eukprot:TRINITY_DN12834_c0_g2_i2.p1 TRINITY_DN12834_c0_g2~~TRINITY_DN12834_c0_g2_i2.p1  ORF type:complete len:711 (+),score=164.83 TRINITY_DN12834_c0_g2_i2:139-2271(+)